MQLKVEPAGVTHGFATGIAPPQTGASGVAVGTLHTNLPARHLNVGEMA